MSTHDRESVIRRQFLQTGSAIAAGTTLVGSSAASTTESKPGMKYRRFGRTNLTLSVIGLGCASGLRSEQLGPTLFNRYREELPAIVDHLLERGGNFVATAAGYHDTEEILGRSLRGRRKGITIFTGSNAHDVKRVRARVRAEPGPLSDRRDQLLFRLERLERGLSRTASASRGRERSVSSARAATCRRNTFLM